MHVEGALAEVEVIRALAVTIRTGVEVGRDVQAADLLRDHDAVFIGVGLGADGTLGISGESGAGVIGATAWIERLKLEPGYALTGRSEERRVGKGCRAGSRAERTGHHDSVAAGS